MNRPSLRRVDKPPAALRAEALQRATEIAADLARTAAIRDLNGRLSIGDFQALADAGLLGLASPESLGGVEADLATQAGVVGRIARGDPSVALILVMHYLQHGAMARWPRHLAGRLLREAIDGPSLVNALRVEPQLGSPARGGLPDTIARAVPGGWRISGHKIYSTGSLVLSWYVVWARTDEPEPRVGPFLVKSGSPGVRIVETWDHLGLRASGSHDVILEDVMVPSDHAIELAPASEGSRRDDRQSAVLSTLLAALYDGIAREARSWLVNFLRTRVPSNLGAPLATLPRVQEALGRIDARLLVNAGLLDTQVRLFDSGTIPPGADSGLVKVTVTENAIGVVEEALRLSGNHGLTRANPLERHHRDVLCGRVHTPQEDSAFVAAGLRALGL
jgi:alkylation response protein AidB-like acyl-CoA dehydrogenase